MLNKLKDFITSLGCFHPRLTFPQTSKGQIQAHQVCLDCGREFEYKAKALGDEQFYKKVGGRIG